MTKTAFRSIFHHPSFIASFPGKLGQHCGHGSLVGNAGLSDDEERNDFRLGETGFVQPQVGSPGMPRAVGVIPPVHQRKIPGGSQFTQRNAIGVRVGRRRFRAIDCVPDQGSGNWHQVSVFDAEKLGPASERGEGFEVGAGHPGLEAEAEDLAVEGRATGGVQVSRDFIERC